jgi:hypothetical protein
MMSSATYRVRLQSGPGTAHAVPETAAIRLLALLPSSWHGEVTALPHGFHLDVTGEGLTPADVRREVERAMRDDVLAGWHVGDLPA